MVFAMHNLLYFTFYFLKHNITATPVVHYYFIKNANNIYLCAVFYVDMFVFFDISFLFLFYGKS